VPIKILAQQTDNDQSTPPSGSSNDTTDNKQSNSTNTQPDVAVVRQPSPSPASSINTNVPEPSNTGDTTTIPEPTAPDSTDTVASTSNIIPAGTGSEPGPKLPKVASVEPDNTEEEGGVASG
jgi:hypothetical protein